MNHLVGRVALLSALGWVLLAAGLFPDRAGAQIDPEWHWLVVRPEQDEPPPFDGDKFYLKN